MRKHFTSQRHFEADVQIRVVLQSKCAQSKKIQIEMKRMSRAWAGSSRKSSLAARGSGFHSMQIERPLQFVAAGKRAFRAQPDRSAHIPPVGIDSSGPISGLAVVSPFLCLAAVSILIEQTQQQHTQTVHTSASPASNFRLFCARSAVHLRQINGQCC